MHTIVRGETLPGLLTCPILSFQDPVHLGLKLRGRILNRDARGVRLGNGIASLGQLIEMIGSTANAYCENDLGIYRSDACPFRLLSAFVVTSYSSTSMQRHVVPASTDTAVRSCHADAAVATAYSR